VALFGRWCIANKEKSQRKSYWTFVEKAGGRDEVRDALAETVRSHYERLERIAEDVSRLGFETAAEILRAELPQTAKARSGDLGEILATELVEEEIGLRVPVRRLRYKDGRNMALRGDDFTLLYGQDFEPRRSAGASRNGMPSAIDDYLIYPPVRLSRRRDCTVLSPIPATVGRGS